MNFLRTAVATLCAACLTACATAPRDDESRSATVDPPIETSDLPSGTGPAADAGRALEQVVRRQIGAPYRLGGASPETGFDCSGLVVYAHRGLGIEVPRTSAEQFLRATPVPLAELRPGDLVFFRIDPGVVDHVGVYLGGGEFAHAARPGRGVALDRLDEPFFAARFVGAGRYWR